MNPGDEVAEKLGVTARQYLEVVAADVPTGLDLLRRLRTTLADLYAALVRVPPLGISPAMTTWAEHVETRDAQLEARLFDRLPGKLYWSALKPLTWDTVGDKGGRDLAQLVGYIAASLEPVVSREEGASPPSVVLHSFGLEMDELAPPVLAALAILEEIVADLEAYERR